MVYASDLSSYEFIDTEHSIDKTLSQNDTTTMLVNRTMRLWRNICLKSYFNKWIKYKNKIQTIKSVKIDLGHVFLKLKNYAKWSNVKHQSYHKMSRKKLYNAVCIWKNNVIQAQVQRDFIQQKVAIAINNSQFDLIQLRHCFLVWTEHFHYRSSLKKHERLFTKSHNSRTVEYFLNVWIKQRKEAELPILYSNPKNASVKTTDCIIS